MKVLALFAPAIILVASCSSPSAVTVDGADATPETVAIDIAAEVHIVSDILAQELPDLAPNDLAVDLSEPEIPPLGCDPGEGCFLDQCAENADCQSG